jgi:TonB family protein
LPGYKKEAPVKTLGILIAVLVAASPVSARQADAARRVLYRQRLVKSVKPNYTPGAMRARIEGTVVMSAVVREDGTGRRDHDRKSLDATYGLDEEAIKALKLWKFEPGTVKEKPSRFACGSRMDFNLRERAEPQQ